MAAEYKKIQAEQRAGERAAQEHRQLEADRVRALAEYDALSAERRSLRDAEVAFRNYQEQSEVAQRDQRPALVGALNRLNEAAQAWSGQEDRLAAADLLIRVFDAIGWADPGRNRDQ